MHAICQFKGAFSDSKVHGANMGRTLVLSAPHETHAGPTNLAIGVLIEKNYGIMPIFIEGQD